MESNEKRNYAVFGGCQTVKRRSESGLLVVTANCAGSKQGTINSTMVLSLAKTIPQQLQIHIIAQSSSGVFDACSEWISLINPNSSHISAQGKTERVKK